LMDFLPEALSLGAVFSHDHKLGLLLAAFIALQNFPEGFNAYREMVLSGEKPRTVLGLFALISLLGPAMALAGHLFFQDMPGITAGIMAFAAGGILYLIFQDIAPQSRLERHWSPTLGSVLGFLLGMMGHVLIG
ncbi:MAG TPA: divalent cation transporter, partial [Leptospiraceae bacterium]|nr:divalent cation transporter [Leptospiraceae bacterium]